MKITDVKLRFAKHYLFVQIYTDAGITGLGEAGNWGYLQATAAAIEKFAGSDTAYCTYIRADILAGVTCQ